jgi:hypothetical protein
MNNTIEVKSIRGGSLILTAKIRHNSITDEFVATVYVSNNLHGFNPPQGGCTVMPEVVDSEYTPKGHVAEEFACAGPAQAKRAAERTLEELAAKQTDLLAEFHARCCTLEQKHQDATNAEAEINAVV